MHNPLVLYSEELLDAIIAADHRYFVRQSYPRGMNSLEPDQKAAFLITHYVEEAKAKLHFGPLANDRYRYLYDISRAEDEQKLRTASRQPTGYRIYAALLYKEWKATSGIESKVRTYIDNILRWRPGRNDRVYANLFLQYGELFVTLKFDRNQVKVRLSDIEKLNSCVTISPFHLQLN